MIELKPTLIIKGIDYHTFDNLLKDIIEYQADNIPLMFITRDTNFSVEYFENGKKYEGAEALARVIQLKINESKKSND